VTERSPSGGDDRAGAALAAVAELGFGVAEISGGRLVDVDDRIVEMLGYSRDELLSLPDLAPLFLPDRRRGLVDLIDRVLAGDDATLPGAGFLLRRNGTPIEVWYSARTHVDDAGARRLLLVIRDATHEARQRDELAAYVEVFQRMPMGLVIWRVEDPDDPASLRLVAVNRAATAGSGMRPAELVGRTFADIFTGPSGRPRAEAILEAHRTRALRDLGEIVATESDGFFGPGTYRRAVIPLPGDMVASLIENVTARREADRHRRELLERILDAGAEERRRIAVGLHDDVIQTLAAAALELDATRRRRDLEVLDGAAADVETSIRAVIGRLRGLVFELAPPELEEGLAAGVDVAAHRLFAGTPTQVATTFDLAVEPDPETREMAYRIVAEALANVRRHAAADSVAVDLRSDERWLTGTVADDGQGTEDLVTPPGHLGLRTMKERAELLGGTCAVRSAPGEGTTVEFRVPVRS
jgi:PAS domain S-box-containing protein